MGNGAPISREHRTFIVSSSCSCYEIRDFDSDLWPRLASDPLVPISVCLKKSMREFQNFTNILKPELQWTSRRFTIQEIFSEETRQKPPESSVHTRRATSRTTPCTWGWRTFLPVGKMKSMDRLWTRVKNPSDDRNAAKRAILLYKIDHIWRDSYPMSSRTLHRPNQWYQFKYNGNG